MNNLLSEAKYSELWPSKKELSRNNSQKDSTSRLGAIHHEISSTAGFRGRGDDQCDLPVSGSAPHNRLLYPNAAQKFYTVLGFLVLPEADYLKSGFARLNIVSVPVIKESTLVLFVI